METRVSSNIKQALTTDICFLKDGVKVLAWYIVCVFLVRFIVLHTKQIPRDDVPFFSEFYRMISNTLYT